MFNHGDHVQHGREGPVMKVNESNSDQTSCEWVDEQGTLRRQSFPTASLTHNEHVADGVTAALVERRW